jgi:dUTPase
MNKANEIVYYVDYEKAQDKQEAKGIKIEPAHPVIKNDGMFSDAGIDLFAAHDFSVEPHSFTVVDTFVGVIMPAGVAGLLWPRGGDIFILGSGVIDTGYTGTIKVKIVNPYNTVMNFTLGSSIGQLVFFNKGIHSMPELREVTKVYSEQYNLYMEKRGDDGRINNAEQLR